MNKNILAMLSFLLVLSSCRKKTVDPGYYYLTREERAVYQPDKLIDTFSNINGSFYTVDTGGTDDVFLYRNMWGWSDDIFDNEYSASVWFAVDSGQTSFSYSGMQLAEHRCYYLGSGAGYGYGFEALDNGTISGVKNADGSWEISIDVKLKGVDNQAKLSTVVAKRTFLKEGYY